MTKLPDTPPTSLRFPKHNVPVGLRTLVMGVLNVTPDSFSDGGKFLDKKTAVEHALKMVEEGADIIDIGGESSRPYAEAVEEKEELRRVIPVIEALASEVDIPLSIDTCKSSVAREAVRAGASMINDITAGMGDANIIPAAVELGVPLVLMHMKGTPRTMQDKPHYDDVVGEIAAYLASRATAALSAGLDRSMVVVDPGVGFGKTVEHNLEIIANLDKLAVLNLPILVGPSRKSFIGKILDLPVDKRQEGTDAVVAACVLNGAHIVRVHDVGRTARVVRMCDAIRNAGVR